MSSPRGPVQGSICFELRSRKFLPPPGSSSCIFGRWTSRFLLRTGLRPCSYVEVVSHSLKGVGCRLWLIGGWWDWGDRTGCLKLGWRRLWEDLKYVLLCAHALHGWGEGYVGSTCISLWRGIEYIGRWYGRRRDVLEHLFLQKHLRDSVRIEKSSPPPV